MLTNFVYLLIYSNYLDVLDCWAHCRCSALIQSSLLLLWSFYIKVSLGDFTFYCFLNMKGIKQVTQGFLLIAFTEARIIISRNQKNWIKPETKRAYEDVLIRQTGC